MTEIHLNQHQSGLEVVSLVPMEKCGMNIKKVIFHKCIVFDMFYVESV